MIKLLLILMLALTINSFGQNSSQFIINEVRSHAGMPKFSKRQFKVNPDNIFEDSTYIVSKSCFGEFGGTIKFRNKINGKIYSAASTCPVVVNKIGSTYYVTNTLAHMAGFSEVIEINNPESMTVIAPGEGQTSSTVGTKQLLDSMGVLTLATFPYKNELYHVVANYKNTFLTKIINGKFVTIDTVSNDALRAYGPEIFTTADKHYLVFFESKKAKGYLDIFENKIQIVRRK